jgi:1-aminocyclopropane-1-carboxylate deaminase/D-cysteine desulfhydrase-like pyridoxal-dependent ACC family enzyme
MVSSAAQGLAYYALHGTRGLRTPHWRHRALSDSSAKNQSAANTRADRMSGLRQSLGTFTRVPLGVFPTPLDACPRLSEAIGPIEVYVKRDDLTGLAFGGNKVRHLEYVFGDALQRGATAIISGSNAHANLPRQVAAACAKLGMRPFMLLRGEKPAHVGGNLLIYALMNGQCRFVPLDTFYENFSRLADEWASELAAAGERPYIFDDVDPDSHGLGLAALGYVNALLELEAQFQELRWQPDVVYMCSAVTSQAGVAAAMAATEAPYRLVGISARNPGAASTITRVANQASALLELDHRFATDEITNLSDYIGPIYGKPTPESMAATRMAAQTEGLLLDPVYTGKALAAVIDHVRQGVIAPGSRVLFWHTGGTPALFDPEVALAIEDGWQPGGSAMPAHQSPGQG